MTAHRAERPRATRTPFFGAWASLGLVVVLTAACAPSPGTDATATPARDHTAQGVVSAKQGASTRRFLEIRVSGQPVGGLEATREVLEDGRIRTTDRSRISLERTNGGMVDRFLSETHSETTYAPDFTFLRERVVRSEGGVDTVIALERQGDQLRYRYEGPGRTEDEKYPLPPRYRSGLSVFEELKARVDAGEPLPTSITYESFDSDDKRFEARTVTVDGIIEHAPRPNGDSGRAFRIIETDDEGSITRAIVDELYMPLEVEMFDGVLLGVAVPHDPFAVDHYAQITSEMPVKGGIDRWWTLKRLDLVVEVNGDDPQRPALFETNQYQRVEREGTRYDLTLLATRLPEGYKAPPLPLSPPAKVAKYLEPTPLSQSDDPRILDLAASLADGSKDPVEVARNINAFVFTGLEKKSGARGNATATEVLEQRAGDCTEHAALTVALMRAAGIPARNVSGIVYLTDPDGKGLAGYHAWAEVWLGRWVGVDAVFGEMGTSARYLMTGYAEPGEREDEAVGRTLGRIRIEVRGFQRVGEPAQTLTDEAR